MTSYDYVIVGAGAAGCVLAYRLTQDPSVSVALLEAGGSGRHPFVQMPKGLAKVMTDPRRIWAYPTEPEAGNGFRGEVWARGRLLGGSSAINGMMYVRGQPDDYAELAAQTSDDWSWEHMGQAYRELECHELGAAPTRGASGPLRLSLAKTRNPLLQAMFDAGVALGWEPRDDFNAPDNAECIAWASRTIWNGVRQSAYTAFVEPVLQRPNLTVMTGVTVDKVLFDGCRASGVSVQLEGQRAIISASREVLLCGGAMASPGILERSGIGQAARLRDLGIEVRVDSPGVGENLQEHRIIMVQWQLNSADSENREYSGWRLLKNVLRYYLNKSGPMASAAFEICARMKSAPTLERPDIQFIIAPYSFDFASGREQLESRPGMNVACHPLRPTSRGHIHITSADPAALPQTVPNYRATASDRQLMIDTVKAARAYAASAPLRPLIAAETYPGPQAQSDDAIIAAYDQYASCGYHAIGTCRMGSDAGSVLDPQLQVRGVSGLRVVDTAAFPQMPSGNTNGPTMALAWRAADLILAARA
jgi:choline dehydrogenase-like flavoprotein